MSPTIGSEERKISRGQRLFERNREDRDAGKLSIWRARLLTESDEETQGLPVAIRRARAFEKIITKIPIFIEDDQLLVGDFASKPLWVEWYPETSVDWVQREIATEELPFGLARGDEQEVTQICQYWKQKCAEAVFRETMLSEGEYDRLSVIGERGAHVYRILSRLDRWGGYHVPNYKKLIEKGCVGIISEIDSELKATRVLNDELLQKVIFLKALKIVYLATAEYGKRYARLAREMSKKAGDPQRKLDLEKIARVCEWVPENPSRSFHEALQTMWFTHVLISLETKPNGLSPGRLDEFLYPYYKHDIDHGTLTREETIELLQCLRVKMNSLRFFSPYSYREGVSGDAQFHNVTLGGQTGNGEDSTNELSYLFLEAARRTPTPHHTLSIRWHQKLSEDFFRESIKLATMGKGWPAFFNDDANIRFLMDMGASEQDARGYAIGGCVVPYIPGQGGAVEPFGLNAVKPLELLLYDGVDPYTGKQVGMKTGLFENFETFGQVMETYFRQLKYFLDYGADFFSKHRALLEAMLPPLFDSALIEGCIQTGKSRSGAGPRFHYQYVNARSMIDAADSLAAIKKCVFEDKSIGKRELIDALKANFQGYESVKKLLLKAPKFGNDDDYADSIAHDVYDGWERMVTALDALYGRKYLACAYSAAGHHAAGKKVGALPSGRLAGKSLAEGSVSPCQGVDTKGPTAVINSSAKIDQSRILATLLNIKFNPGSIALEEKLPLLGALIKTYFEKGGKHIQFNVVERETLLEARTHPEQHRNLLVRVAGYSAYFVELERGVQDEIIERTTHQL